MKKIIIIFVFCILLCGCFNNNSANKKEKKPSVEQSTSKEIDKCIRRKYKNTKINIDSDKKYIITSYIEPISDGKITSAEEGIDFINCVKKYHQDIDDKIKEYNIVYYNYACFYSKDNCKRIYSSKYINQFTDIIDSIEIMTLETSDSEVITKSQIENERNNYKNQQAIAAEKAKYDIEVDSKDLSDTYYNNELDGNKKYFGKKIKTKARFWEVEKGKITGWNMILMTDGAYSLYCRSFKEGEEKHFSEYNREETLTIYGTVDELSGSFITLDDCDLEK